MRTHGREGVEEAGNVGHDAPLVRLGVAHVLDLEQLRDAEVFLRDAERETRVAVPVCGPRSACKQRLQDDEEPVLSSVLYSRRSGR